MVKNNDNKHEYLFLKLKELLKDINYGSITLVVQDGKVIQIERNEKHRL